mgnify:CR=1 FL=1|tara:strand:+ start:173 stop:694 length:522 start_codon:yes stop_codon:yes gene_type:complete
MDKLIITADKGSIFGYSEEMSFIKNKLGIEKFDFNYTNYSWTLPDTWRHRQYIDGELESVIGYDWLYNVHQHPPTMKEVGDVIDGLLFVVEDKKSEEYEFDSGYMKKHCNVSYEEFKVVKDRKLFMIPILYYLAHIEPEYVEQGILHKPITHTYYAKADNNVSRKEIEWVKNV